jgi:spore coat protein U-like protein
MASGTNTLQYNLYTTNGYATVWGNTTGSWQSGTGAGLGTTNSLTVYGQIPDSATNQAAVPATTYADTITVTVTY